jgi:hypothetical protein
MLYLLWVGWKDAIEEVVHQPKVKKDVLGSVKGHLSPTTITDPRTIVKTLLGLLRKTSCVESIHATLTDQHGGLIL